MSDIPRVRGVPYAFWLMAVMLGISGCAGPVPPAGSEAEKGASLFRKQGCASCHRMGGTGGRLDGITGRRNREWFEMHLRNPSAVRPGSMMPAFSLKPEQTMALWEYLRFLDGAMGPESRGPAIPFERTEVK